MIGYVVGWVRLLVAERPRAEEVFARQKHLWKTTCMRGVAFRVFSDVSCGLDVSEES